MAYQGGKQRLGKKIYTVLLDIEKQLKKDKLDYLEPFVGFCGVIKHFGNEDRKLFGYDSNESIIEMWGASQQGWKPPKTCSKEQYEKLKNQEKPTAEKGFVGVACSYSGIFFVGYRGEQTFKNGTITKTVNSAAMAARSVNRIASMIKNVKFKACKYQDIDPKNMLIYCDPPYKSNKYQQSIFFQFDSEEFWVIMRKWSKSNIVVISEYKAPYDFRIIWKNEIKVIHNGKTNTKTEKLFIHEDLYKKLSVQFLDKLNN